MSKPAQPNRSLIDGIEVLLAAADATEPVGVRDLARRLGLETTRTQRLLGTLAHLGLLHQNEDRRYQPGPGLNVLGAIATSQQHVLPPAVPLLSELAQSHQAVVALGTLWRDRVAYLAVTGADRDPLSAVGANPSFPIAESAIGMLLLGWRDEAYATSHGVMHSFAAAQHARSNGFAIIDQKDNKKSLAMPILPRSGDPSLAIACSVLTTNFNQTALQQDIAHACAALQGLY